MKTKEAYNVLFVDYPDIVNVEQMGEMLGGMDKQIEESEPKKQEEILSLCGAAISVKYAEQDDPHITEALKRSVFSYGFYNSSYKT